jgi:autotransporter-associated beta strand protein
LVLTNTSNAYSGGTVISGGTLSLLFGTAGTNDIISNNTALTLNGGTLSMSGVAGGSNTQTFSGTTIGAGAASASQALSAGTLTMNFGNFTRSAGGTLNVAPSTVAASNFTGNINTQLTSSVITSGHVAYLTVNGTNWATLTGGNATPGNITALTSTATANGSWLSTVNDLITTQAITMNTGSVSNESLNSLVFNGAASSIALNGGTLTMTTGGILANATGADTISGGNLTASNGELVLIVNSALPANNLSISGNIVGAIAVTKSGTGNLSLTGTLSNYSGGTYLNQGTLSLGNAAALGTGTLNINGGTLDASSALAVTNAQNWNGNWTFGGSSALTLGNSSNTTALGANVTLTTAGNTLTIAGAITDASAFYLTKAGNTGTLALNGTNTFTGGLILSAGTLDINSATALGGTASVFTINSNATSNTTIDNTNTALTVTNHNAQIWNGNFTFTGTNNLDLGTGAVALGANDTITVIGHTLSIDGNIGGSTTSGASSNTLPSQFGLTLGNGTAGSGGTLALTGNNNYNGGTTVTNGTLVLSGNNIGTGNTTLSGVNSVLDINQGGNSTASALGTGTLVIGALSTIDNTNASLTVMTNNAVNINGNFTFTGTHSLGLGTGNITLGTATPNITVTANTLTLGGAISDATGTAWGLTKVGAGTLDLGGNNTYTGATAVNAGTLELSGTTGNNALGINALGTTVNSGATLQLDNGYITGGSTGSSSTGSLLTLNGAGNISATDGGALLNNGTTQWNGNIALATSATISAGTGAAGVLTLGNLTALVNYQDYGNISNISINSNTLTFTGAPGSLISVDANITGNGGSIVVNSGVEVYLNAPNDSYSGNTTVLNGTLGIDGVTPGADVTAGQGNLSVPGNIIIGSGSGTATDANLTYFDGGSGNLINDMASVTIKADGVFDLAGVEQMIGNLSMTGGCITLGTGGTLDTNGNASITISANTDASLISQGRFNLGNSAGTTTTPISVAAGANFTISSRLTGGNFIQSGDGTMSLINQAVGGLLQNTFTGFAEIQGGTLVITASNALGTSDNLVGDGTKVDAGAQLQLTQTTGNLAVAVPNELLTLNGSGPAGAGALQSVNGTNSWAGSVIVNSSATVNTTTGSLTFAPTGGGTGTFSSNISSSTGATLTFIGAGNTTISTPLAGASNNLNLYSNMSTGSTLLISNISTNNTYSGTTTVNNGILELQGHTTAGGTNLIANSNNLTINTHGTLLTDTNNTLGPSVNMVLNGGTWETNAANAGGTGLTAFSSTTTTLSANGKATAQATFAETLNTLTLTGTSNITLGSGSNIINFAASNGVNWTPGQVLYINNWNGTFATSISANYTDGLIGGGGTDQIIFDGGGNYAGLDGSAYTGQLGEIVFVNPQDAALGFNGATGDFNAVITNDGEVVPFVTVPEPGTLAAGAALGGLALLREWRRRKNRAAPAIVS